MIVLAGGRGTLTTRGAMVTVLAGGTVTLTAVGALVESCLMGTDTMSEASLAATGALAVGCFGMLEGNIAEMGATKEGGLGAQPDSLAGSLRASRTRAGST